MLNFVARLFAHHLAMCSDALPTRCMAHMLKINPANSIDGSIRNLFFVSIAGASPGALPDAAFGQRLPNAVLSSSAGFFHHLNRTGCQPGNPLDNTAVKNITHSGIAF